MHLIFQGAEARLFKAEFFGRHAAVKERFPKKYRLESLDHKLRSQRTRQELRTLMRLPQVGVRVPRAFYVDNVKCVLVMEWIDGCTVKQKILDSGGWGAEGGCDVLGGLASAIGASIGKMHNAGIVHGDLTSSNMLLEAKTGNLVLIDFGLSGNQGAPEDKAVDLYVLERSFVSTHADIQGMIDAILSEYAKQCDDAKDVLGRLEEEDVSPTRPI